MSFRSRLLVFFTIIVIIPMLAVTLVLFGLTADSETGKADSRIAQGLRVALTLYEEERERASGALDRVAGDPAMMRALAGDRVAAARRRLAELVREDRAVKAIALYDENGREVARAGAGTAVAPAAAAPTIAGGRRIGTLVVSVATAAGYARRVKELTGLETRLARDGRSLVSTLGERSPPSGRSGDVEIDGRDYRGRSQTIQEAAGPPLEIGLFDDAGELSSSIRDSRLLIGGILLAFLLLALASSVFVVRALQGQIAQFLEAARRLGRGDFAHPVPIQGGDEFAALGTEFNRMSGQLESQIEEVDRKRRELEGAIRRVGDAFAAGLDRQGIVDLAVRTAVEACAAEAGRALPIDRRKMSGAYVGAEDSTLRAALEAAEREAFRVRARESRELRVVSDPGASPSFESTGPAYSRVDGVHALAVPLSTRIGTGGDVEYVGIISIARTESDFHDSERDLFGYLAAQAAVSIENAGLHETIQLQAVTDELTGLFNVRHFHQTLDGEIERIRRFPSDLGLVMLDIDDFKRINDTFGHQQGDVVLLEVARVLRELSRDIDEPARYGGEELAVILPQTDVDGAELAAERIRAAIERLGIKSLSGDRPLRITASFGVASMPAAASDKNSLIAAADAALYRAKRAGKNRVERAEPAAAPS